MTKLTIDTLNDIEQKVIKGERLTFQDGVRLLKSNNLFKLGQMANVIRQRKNENNVYFTVNTHLNYTNVCYYSCKVCSYGQQPNHPQAYTLSLEQIEERCKEISKQEMTELHIIGGINAKLPFSYYEEIIRIAKKYNPKIHVQAFTAVEVDYLARISKMSVEEVILRLRDAGLGSIHGGGAEIFDPQIRQIISGHKTNAERWFEIHEISHRLGMKSNASIIYGHIEQPEHVIDHLLRLRELQDQTGGFQAFFPFSFHPDNTKLAEEYNLTGKYTSGFYDLKILSVARLMLDNFPHIRVLWTMIGLKMAQIALQFGVDDLDGTSMDESFVYHASNQPLRKISKQDFVALIKETGLIPVERDAFYNPLEVY